jgi:hypothetical protein
LTSIDWNKYFDYVEGFLVWKVSRGRVKAGQIAGNVNGAGYWQVMLDGRNHMVARIVWELHNGAIAADCEIDHFDRDRQNNLIENLREKTPSRNCHNRENPANKHGFPGVQKVGTRFSASIQDNVGRRYLGRFDTAEAASAVYQAEKAKYS